MPSVLFLSCFPTKTLYIFIFFCHESYMTWPSQLPSSDYVITPDEETKLRSSSLYSFLQPLVTCFPLGPNFLSSTLFSNIFNLCLKILRTPNHFKVGSDEHFVSPKGALTPLTTTLLYKSHVTMKLQSGQANMFVRRDFVCCGPWSMSPQTKCHTLHHRTNTESALSISDRNNGRLF
jgi:hypothetical protein